MFILKAPFFDSRGFNSTFRFHFGTMCVAEGSQVSSEIPSGMEKAGRKSRCVNACKLQISEEPFGCPIPD